MNVDPVTSTIILVFCGITAVAGTYAIYKYNRVSPWLSTPIGRWYMGLLIVFTAGFYMIFISKAITGDVTRVVWVILSILWAGTMIGNAWAIGHTQRLTDKALAEDAERNAAAEREAEAAHQENPDA